MITVDLTDSQILRAESLYEFGSLNGSITEGASNVYGALGEIVFEDRYIGKYDRVNSYDYDFRSCDGSITVDVKTKRTTALPRSNWRCSISAFNIRQKCDFYFFIRVLEDKSKAFILGYISKEEFFDIAVFFKAGDPDPDKPNWKFAGDCYNVYVKDLHMPSWSSGVECDA